MLVKWLKYPISNYAMGVCYMSVIYFMAFENVLI